MNSRTLAPLPALLALPANHRSSLFPYLPSHESNAPSQHYPMPSLRPHPFKTTPSLAPSASSTDSPASHPLPHLTLTYATSLDASLALAPGLQTALSGPESKAMTHYLRAMHDAILIGANTAIVDDPSLNCRHVGLLDEDETMVGTEVGIGGVTGMGAEIVADRQRLKQQPVPVILDPSARWRAPAGCKVLKLAREGGGRGVLWVVGKEEEEVVDGDEDGVRDAVGRVRDAGGEILFAGRGLRSEGGGVEWELLLELLAKRGIRSVMVEGGATVVMDLLRVRNQKLVSSVIITIAPVWLGEGGVVVSPPRNEVGMEVGRLVNVKWLPMGEDVVMAGNFPHGR